MSRLVLASWGRRALVVAVSTLLTVPLGLGVPAAVANSEPAPVDAAITTEGAVGADPAAETGAPVDGPAHTVGSAPLPSPARPEAPLDPATAPTPVDTAHPTPVEISNAPAAPIEDPVATQDRTATSDVTDAAAPVAPDTTAKSEVDGATGLVAEGIGAGQTRSVPLDVVDASGVRAVVVGPVGVEIRLTRPSDGFGVWVGGDRENKQVFLGTLPERDRNGRWTLEIRNGTDRTVNASYELAFHRSGEVRMSVATSTGGQQVGVQINLRDEAGAIRGAEVTGVLTGDNGLFQPFTAVTGIDDLYRWSSGTLRPGYYTVVVRVTVAGVEHSDVNWARVVGTDGEPPVVTAVTNPANHGPGGWFTGPVSVDVAAEDPPGVFVLWHQIGDGPRSADTASSVSIPVTEDGVNEVSAWAWDRLHNVSEPVVTTVRLDRSAPVVASAGVLETGTVRVGESAIAELHCEDPHSGIDVCVVDIADGPVVPEGGELPTDVEGTIRYELWAVNNAGLETRTPGTLEVVAGGDETPPTVVVTTEPAASNARGWFRRDVTATITASDSGSGVAWVEYRTGGEWTRVAGNEVRVPVAVDGQTQIEYRAADNAGNLTSVRTRLIQLDRVPPTVRIDPSIDGVEVPIGEVLPAAFTCGDSHSGILTCDGSTPHGAALPTDTPGAYELSVTAVDRAGNEVTGRAEYTVVHDDPAPQLGAVAELSAEPNEHGWFKEPVTVDIRGIEGSGAETVHWELEGAQTGSGSAAGSGVVTVDAEGDTVLSFWAEDAQGGASEPVRVDLRVDVTAPGVTYGDLTPESLTPADGAEVAERTFEVGDTVFWMYSCIDDVSGIDSCDSEVGNRSSLPTGTAGTFEVRTTATDLAGHETVDVLTYTVVDPSGEPGPGPGPVGPSPGTGEPTGGGPSDPSSGPSVDRGRADELAATGQVALPLTLALLAPVLIGGGVLLIARRRSAEN